MKAPTVSVVVPVYNVAQWLPQCLKSVVEQSYEYLEVLVVDDGSTDKSGAIADEWAMRDARIKVVHQSNAGLSASRNVAVAMATGEYVCFVDADDYLAPSFVETLLSAALERAADCAVCNWTEFRDCDGLKPEVARQLRPTAVNAFTPQEALYQILYQKKLTQSSCARICKTEVLRAVHFPEGLLYEDLAVVVPWMSRVNQVVWVDAPLYYYRVQRKGSILTTFSKKRADVFTVLDEVEKQVREAYPELLPAVESRRLSAYFNMLRLIPPGDPCYAHLVEQCWLGVKQLRGGCLRDRNTRLRNKVASLISYFGKTLLVRVLHLG